MTETNKVTDLKTFKLTDVNDTLNEQWRTIVKQFRHRFSLTRYEVTSTVGTNRRPFFVSSRQKSVLNHTTSPSLRYKNTESLNRRSQLSIQRPVSVSKYLNETLRVRLLTLRCLGEYRVVTPVKDNQTPSVVGLSHPSQSI